MMGRIFTGREFDKIAEGGNDMLTNPDDYNSKSRKLSNVFLFIFLFAAVIFILLIYFFLPCQLKEKLVITSAFCITELLSFIYFRLAVDSAVKAKRAQMEITLAEIKDCQKGLLVDEKIATIAKFASVMAHELKNPLSSLKNISYYLIKTVKSEDPKARRMMDMLSSEVDRANEMITDFSDIARAKRVNKTSINVSELIENVLNGYKFDPGIELAKEIEPGIESNIDPDRMSQSLKNLLKNAKGSIVETGQIKVTLKKADKSFMLSVTDSGCGIDKEAIGHIYEPLFTTKTKSIGLGLTVVRQTIEAHGGRIEVESEKDKGATFRVFIPL